MLSVLNVTFPFFALVLCGYVAARRGLLPLAAIPGLNGFVLYFALPCMLYRFGAQTPVAQLFDPRVALLYLGAGLGVVALALWQARRARLRWADAALGALVAAFPNSGFMGVPLLVALLGAGAAGTVIVTILVDMVLVSSLCIALSQLDQARGTRGAAAVWASARGALRGVASNPMPWSILLGALVSGLGLRPPGPLAATVGLLADAASPVALFTIGAVLARSQMLAAQDRAHAVAWGQVLPVAGLKLLVHPVLLWGLCSMALVAGLGLASQTVAVLVLVAALPSASNVSLLAERFGANNGRIARIILVSTAVAFLSFSGAVALVLGPR